MRQDMALLLQALEKVEAATFSQFFADQRE